MHPQTTTVPEAVTLASLTTAARAPSLSPQIEGSLLASLESLTTAAGAPSLSPQIEGPPPPLSH